MTSKRPEYETAVELTQKQFAILESRALLGLTPSSRSEAEHWVSLIFTYADLDRRRRAEDTPEGST